MVLLIFMLITVKASLCRSGSYLPIGVSESCGRRVRCMSAGRSSQLVLSVKEKRRRRPWDPSLQAGYTCPYFRTALSPASQMCN